MGAKALLVFSSAPLTHIPSRRRLPSPTFPNSLLPHGAFTLTSPRGRRRSRSPPSHTHISNAPPLPPGPGLRVTFPSLSLSLCLSPPAPPIAAVGSVARERAGGGRGARLGGGRGGTDSERRVRGAASARAALPQPEPRRAAPPALPGMPQGGGAGSNEFE